MTSNRYNKIIEQMTTSDIVELVGQFGVSETSIQYHNNQLIMPTCCHNEIIGTAKHKLYYYENTKRFYCYTCCGAMSVFDFIIQVYKTRGIKYTLSNAAIVMQRIIQKRLKDGFAILNASSQNVKPKEVEDDWHKKLTEYNSAVMDCFSRNKKYLKIWEKEGISFDAMDKFGIKFDMVRNRMVIPIYDDRGKFIGAKVRNFNMEEIENGRKYMPLIHNKEVYTYDRGKVLYGLNFNKQAIRKAKRAIIFESEKATLQYESMFVGNRAVSIGGSNITPYQRELLKHYGVEIVVLALDNDYSLIPNEEGEYNKYFGLSKMIKEGQKLDKNGFKVEIVYDWEQEYLDNKDAPIDKGRIVWNKLYRNRKPLQDFLKKKGETDEEDKMETKEI